MAVNRMFRTCPSTGLVYHEPAEKLIKWNAVAGVVSLLVGGVLALLVTLTRWPAVHLAHWSFYLSLIIFAVGALIGCFVFFGTLAVGKAERTYNGSVPLVTFGALTAAIIAVFTIASGAIILIPTFLWSLGLVDYIDSLMYKTVWWAFGHSSQQINVSAHVAVWYAIAAIVFGAKPLS